MKDMPPDHPAGSIGVLVCDDNHLLRRLLREVIELRPTLRVLGEAADGIAAISEAARLQPDVILLDLAMPRRTGLEALVELRQVAPAAKIIVLSGFPAGAAADEAIRLGASRYLVKGADVATINDAIEQVAGASGGSVTESPSVRDGSEPEWIVSSRVALASRVEHVFAEVAAAIGLGLYIYEVSDPLDAGSLRLVYGNPASSRAIGADFTDLIGKPLREAFPGLMETALPGIGLEVALGGPARDLGDLEYSNGAVAHRVFAVRVFPLPDQRVGFSFTNMTEQRLAEQRAVETLESMSDAFVMLDSDWRFTYLNRRSETILERRREDLLGKRLWDEVPEVMGSRFESEYRRAVREQTTVRFDGSYGRHGRVLEVRAYPVGQGLAIYYRDVTDARREDERQDEGARLEAIGRSTVAVAHDFNNLLTAIRGFASLGEHAAGDTEQAAKYFSEIELAGRRATTLTRQLLAFGSEQHLTPAFVDLNEVVSDFTSLLEQLLGPNILLKEVLSPRAVTVFIDRAQLEQVILNLVLNGRDAMPEEGTITIVTSSEPPAGLVDGVVTESGWLQVIDTGGGIPEAVAPHIFEPFFTTKPAESGTGLGLATIHRIVAQSGGEIVVDSTIGVGTSMTVRLPAHEYTVPPADTDPPTPERLADSAQVAQVTRREANVSLDSSR